MPASDIPHPATLDEFRQALPRIETLEAEMRHIRRMGALLMLEQALERHPFVHGLNFEPSSSSINPWSLKFAFEIPSGPRACGDRIVVGSRHPGDAPEPANAQPAQLAPGEPTRSMAWAAMDAVQEAVDALVSNFDGARRHAFSNTELKTTAKDAPLLAIQMGLPEIGAAIERARISKASPDSSKTSLACSL